MIRFLFLLCFIFILVACDQTKPNFNRYTDSLQEIKTPLTFVDTKALEVLIGYHDLVLDTLFFGRGYTPVGKIQSTAKTIKLLLLESGIKNKIHIRTYDLNGNQMETYLLDTNYGQINDSVVSGVNYTLKNPNVLIQFDSIQSITHSTDGDELTITTWKKDSMVIFPNSRLKK